MDIMLTDIRISNYRSIEKIDLKLDHINILLGKNNCGKSNFLRAVNIALGGIRVVSAEDIYVAQDEHLDNKKTAIIDILIHPVNKDFEIVKTFSDFWTAIFTVDWITVNAMEEESVGIRTILEYNTNKADYTISRKVINDWGSTIDDAKIGKKQTWTGEMSDYLTTYFMDTHRDAADDLKNKKSYLGRTASQLNLSKEQEIHFEEELNKINSEIMENIPRLRETSDKIATIGATIGAPNSSIEIEPLARKLSDLQKGMDIVFKDGKAAKFPISQYGMGTRSWISFLTLGAYVDLQIQDFAKVEPDSDDYVMLTMEEPEAHLHPQAQCQLYSHILNFSGQKIISTHSPHVLAQANLSDIIHFHKIDGKTVAARFKNKEYSAEELKRIQREVINTRGDLLFSTAIVLCEGITEEQALPIYFKYYFEIEPIFCGINIISVHGQSYKLFLKLIKDFSIPWFIFSDGEKSTIKTVTEAVRVITDEKIDDMPNVVILEGGCNYESYLINSGYQKQIIDAINDCEKKPDAFLNYKNNNNHADGGRKKTDKICKTCGQNIYTSTEHDYDGTDGENKAIYDCCCKNKAKYATYVAEKIISHPNVELRIPPKVKDLFDAIAKDLNISKSNGEHL